MARPKNSYFWFYLQKWGKFQPLYHSSESTFWKIKKGVLVWGLRNLPQKFQTSAMIRKYISCQADNLWFWYSKFTVLRVFIAVFSGPAHELMVPAKPPNSHPRPHLMQREPTDLLNLSRRWTISGVQNVTLYYKIDIVIQLFWCLYKWSLAQGLYKHSTPRSMFNRTRDINSWKIGFL